MRLLLRSLVDGFSIFELFPNKSHFHLLLPNSLQIKDSNRTSSNHHHYNNQILSRKFGFAYQQTQFSMTTAKNIEREMFS